MFHVRVSKTASGATAVQIVRYDHRKTVIVSHIGSAHTLDELASLQEEAKQWMERTTGQKSLFPQENRHAHSNILLLQKSQYIGVRYTFVYDVLSSMIRLLRFHSFKQQLLTDLVIMRVIQPVSKIESLDLLTELFGITHQRRTLYRSIPQIVALKDTVQEAVVKFAKHTFSFDFSIVFYDVTTLYFESFKEDEENFRKLGFSKDNKSNQPQIAIGLIVTKEGFPVSYDVFSGNTFEGKTFIPTICKFRDTYKVKNLTVVADAAMISLPNVQSLVEHNLSYIVGARVASLKLDPIKQISKALHRVNGSSTRIKTERGFLVCDFSLKRYQKDKREMDKQITKAEKLLLGNLGLKRTKFIKNKRKAAQTLNTNLIEKTKLLLGIKGYYTNLTDETDKTIIDHYHNLWHVEQAFRIAKSDLAMRPIYHFKKQTIETHILICFMALAVCKYMELKTGKSTKKIIKLLKSITEARIRNKLTGEIIVMRQETTEEVKKLLEGLSY